MTDKSRKDYGKKEMWGCIGTVTAALITGIIALIIADKIPFISTTPPLIPTFTQTSTATKFPADIPTPSPSTMPLPVQQEVQWIPNNDGIGTAGLCTNDWIRAPSGPLCPNIDNFVPWNIVESELEQHILPLVPNVPSGSTLRLANGSEGQLNWGIDVINPNGNKIAEVWIGENPEALWIYDGLIRVGSHETLEVWATFVRYSNNTYAIK